MGIIKRIFSGKDLLKSIDDTVLSREEQVEGFKTLLPLYEPFKLAQRLLAIMYSAVFLLIHLLVYVSKFIYIVRDGEVGVLEKLKLDLLAEMVKDNNSALGTVIIIIITFYFGGGVIEGTIRRLNNNKVRNEIKKDRSDKRLK